MKWADAHCHVQDDRLFPNLGKVLEHAADAGVERIVCCATNSRDWKQVLQTAEKNPQIYPMIGIHPWFVSSHWKEHFQALEKTVCRVPMLGIGETGLDFCDRFTNRAAQEASFAAHLDLARELDRPVAVHCVQAWGRLIELLKDHPAPKIILHAFGGAPEMIPELVKLNCWFSFCGSVTNPKAKKVRASAAAVPADRLLLETDAPDFPPAGLEPPNEPAHLIHVARAAAALRDVSLEALCAVTFHNTQSLFSR